MARSPYKENPRVKRIEKMSALGLCIEDEEIKKKIIDKLLDENLELLREMFGDEENTASSRKKEREE